MLNILLELYNAIIKSLLKGSKRYLIKIKI